MIHYKKSKHTSISICINVRHDLGLNRPVSASSNNLFKGLPSCLCPFGLKFSTVFGILLLFILHTCRSHMTCYIFLVCQMVVSFLIFSLLLFYFLIYYTTQFHFFVRFPLIFQVAYLLIFCPFHFRLTVFPAIVRRQICRPVGLTLRLKSNT